MQEGFQRELAKATYLLLQRYHRLYGLKAHCWTKPPGNAYISFYLDALPLRGAMTSLPGMDDERLTLTYYQDHVGIPAWSSGRQMQMPGWEHARTADVQAWLEKNLTLHALFENYSEEIAAWRKQYPVLSSEQYLLAWHVAGLLAARAGSYIFNPYAYFSDYDPGFHAKAVAFCREFTDCDPEYAVMALNGVSISIKAECRLRDGETWDLWSLYTKGMSAESIAQSLYEALGPQRTE